MQKQFESQRPAAISYAEDEAMKRRVRSNSLRGVVPSILSSNLKKKRDELLQMESSIVSHGRQGGTSRSQSKSNARLVLHDAQNAVQIFIPGGGESTSIGPDFVSPRDHDFSREEEKITLSRQREIDNNSSMDVETQMVDNFKMLKHEASTNALHNQASYIKTFGEGKILSEHNSPKKRKEWNTARIGGTGRNTMIKPHGGNQEDFSH